MKKGKKNRHRSLSTAETLTLHQLYRDLHRPRILKIEMESEVFEVSAHVDLDSRVPMEIIEQKLGEELVKAAIAAHAMRSEVLDDGPYPWGGKLLRGTLRVVVPKGGF